METEKSYGEWSIIPIFQGVNGYNGWYEGPCEEDAKSIISAHDALPNLIAQVEALKTLLERYSKIQIEDAAQLTAAEKVVDAWAYRADTNDALREYRKAFPKADS